MRFRAEHEFAAPPAAVAEILCDPAFHIALDLPDLSRPEVVSHSADGAERALVLRYTFVGHLDPVARRLLAGRKLTWIQELHLDEASGTGRLSFSAEAEADRLYGSAAVTLTAVAEGTRTRRRIEGEFFVKVPLVGGTAERRIVPGLVRRLDVEAAALTKRLT
jgi:carbon monoxide dehydrogenase subunit G